MLVLVVAGALFVGCSGSPSMRDDAGMDAGVDHGAASEMFVATLSIRYCEALARCPRGYRWTNTDDCVRDQLRSWWALEGGEYGIPWNGPALVRSGQASFDPAAAAACLSDIEARCPTSDSENIIVRRSPCASVFTATPGAPAGARCDADFECGPQGYCRRLVECEPRTCAARHELGASCQGAWQCVQPTGEAVACHETCVDARIASDARAGESCWEQSFMDDQIVYRGCEAGLECLPEEIVVPGPLRQAVCRLPLAEGASCAEEPTLCEFGTICAVRTQSCEPFVFGNDTLPQVGDPCPFPSASFCDDVFRLACDSASMTCQPWGDGTLGALCVRELSALCDPGLVCGPEGRCVPGGADGDSCGWHYDCASRCCVHESMAGPGTCSMR